MRSAFAKLEIETRSFKEPVLFTNLLFLLNGVFWMVAGQTAAAIIVTLTGLASLSYHIPKESMKITRDIDVCCAHIALFFTLYIIYPYANVVEWFGLIGILSVGLYVKNRGLKSDYEFWHTLWHICVFLGQALMAYVTIP